MLARGRPSSPADFETVRVERGSAGASAGQRGRESVHFFTAVGLGHRH